MRSLYDEDFLDWTVKTAELIKNRQFDAVDWDNVVEEIEALGRNDRDKLISSLKVLFTHLLKWAYQPDKRTTSWENTIFRERTNITDYLEDTPSLSQFLVPEWIEKAYSRGLKIAVKETGLDKSVFPRKCPYALEQILDEEFLPG